MYRNVHIVGVGTYHPKRIVENEYFKKHFEKYGMSRQAEILTERLGRNTRTLGEKDDTSLSMGLEAAKKALDNANLTALDIDGIISVSDTPEYLLPCCAVLIRDGLDAKNATNVFDVNSNCIGMITGIDVASRYLKTDKKYKRFLVVGAMLMSPFAREDDIVGYACFSDGGAAVVLEVKEEEEERGMLDYKVLTDSSFNRYTRFPVCGLSKITKSEIKEYDKKFMWEPFDFDILSDEWVKLLTGLLNDNDYNPEDISHYFMSQFSKGDLDLTLEKMGVELSKSTFVGYKYGYTGCTSPFMALDDRLKIEGFKKGDLIIFCSVAVGYTMSAVLYKC
ncbi:3-oxoacyl-[acyl-carrier-protein] synthase III C-terminal domain-containing protein [Clostridium guangxiense]|uniref:3-oxoacyl-[acyl-carrier-protein] synthase III C-terminal domain-containing protein n=1 Tax=Clostridium guangxiense TaxID=1662055 RepID=UPI001E3CF396|nr:3-oxoacyl-[acyl-carrier-protein] synthase III C-terminal domain-containing protein [Clostridium guangxiense]MCD2345565.1 ketoacyl-ACP synthase III [Clostridium guangxiense]